MRHEAAPTARAEQADLLASVLLSGKRMRHWLLRPEARRKARTRSKYNDAPNGGCTKRPAVEYRKFRRFQDDRYMNVTAHRDGSREIVRGITDKGTADSRGRTILIIGERKLASDSGARVIARQQPPRLAKCASFVSGRHT